MLSRTVDIIKNNTTTVGAFRSAGHSFYKTIASTMSVCFSKNTFEVHLIRGRSWYSLNQYHEASEDFEMALRLDWRHEQAAVWIRMAEIAKTY